MKIVCAFCLVLPVILVSSFQCFANEPDLTLQNQLIVQAENKNLSNHPYWKALLHYKKNSLFRENIVDSDIITKEFFLSDSGSHSPSSELKATIKSMFRPVGELPDTHPQCRFIARYQWLQKQLDWPLGKTPFVECNAFERWARKKQTESISLFFATGYLQNPASFYGHILLRFNRGDDASDSGLLETSLDYGAIIPENINPVVYIVKGLVGGFDAGFTQKNFYEQNHNYGEVQLRDLWEYELILNDDQIRQLQAHVWELFTNKFTYYFLDENCAFAMAELLELVINRPLINKPLPWSMPIYVFNNLNKVDANGTHLVKKIRRHPSRRNRLVEKFQLLDTPSKVFVRLYAEGSEDLDSQKFHSLVDEKKYKILDTLIDYYEYLLVYAPDDPVLNKNKQDLLLARISMPASTVDWPLSKKAPPHDGQKPGMFGVEYLNNDSTDNQIVLRFRPSYFDFLSLDIGNPKFSVLAMGDISIAKTEDRLYLKNLDLVRVVSLNPSATGLPGDRDLAWKLEFGYETNDLSCLSCGIANMNGGVGKAYLVNDNTVLYGMIDGRLQENYKGVGHIAVAPGAGMITNLFGKFKTHLSVFERKYLDGTKDHNTIVNLETRLNSSNIWDFRVMYRKHIESEFGLSIRYHL